MSHMLNSSPMIKTLETINHGSRKYKRNNICTTIYTHIMFLLCLSIALVFMSISNFLCKYMVVS